MKFVYLLAAVVTFASTVLAADFGLLFSVGEHPTVGADIRFGPVYEMRPQVGMSIRKDGDYDMSIELENNFIFGTIATNLEHYIGFSPALNFADHVDARFSFRNYYGLQYEIVPQLKLYGHVGYKLDFDPTVFGTFTSGLGLIIFLNR